MRETIIVSSAPMPRVGALKGIRTQRRPGLRSNAFSPFEISSSEGKFRGICALGATFHVGVLYEFLFLLKNSRITD
jgi:hypothetical protein